MVLLMGLPVLSSALSPQNDPCPGGSVRSKAMGEKEGGCCCGGAGHCGCHVKQEGPPPEAGGVNALPEVRQERPSSDGVVAVSAEGTPAPRFVEGDSPAWTLARGPSGPRYLLNLNILC
jgi:hypothetical protein